MFTQILPDVDFFIFMYLRKDAASSSQLKEKGNLVMLLKEVETSSSNR
jgi:hypothetical protein